MTGASELESVLRYHERTKHHFYRFAAGPGRLDWANQQDLYALTRALLHPGDRIAWLSLLRAP